MSQYEFIKDYKDNEPYRLSFNALTQRTFGFDFESWYQRGCWNDRYITYSFLHEHQVISSVSVNRMDIILDHHLHAAIQVGTVMTAPEYRNQGLSRRLMDIVIEEYRTKCDFIYLFANKTVLNFYPKFGFRPTIEPSYSFHLNPTPNNKLTMRKLDIHSPEDWQLLLDVYAQRIPISTQCGVLHAESILTFYCMNVFNEDIYMLEDQNTIIIYQQEDHLLHLYDIISTQKFNLRELMKLLPIQGVDKVIVHFQPDDQETYIQKSDMELDDTLFIYPIHGKINTELKLPKIAQA